MTMSAVERGLFASLFNRGGYVLNFYDADFDAFTLRSVGVAVKSHYSDEGLSKGKSLNRFLEEIDDEKATKLLIDLFEYYEAHYDKEIEEPANGWGDDSYRRLYSKCLPIAERERSCAVSSPQRTDLEKHFTSEYMRQQIETLFNSREENPTEAIGKSKELIESCCKTILEENGSQYDRRWTVPQLVNSTMRCLQITKSEINADLPAGETIKQVLGSLASIAGGIAELRNPYGTGHGKSDSFHGLGVRHARLAVGSSATLVEYLWDAHEWRKREAGPGE
jgi:hypothetical protein